MGSPEKKRSRQYKIQLGPGRPLLEREPFFFLLLFSLVIHGIFFKKFWVGLYKWESPRPRALSEFGPIFSFALCKPLFWWNPWPCVSPQVSPTTNTVRALWRSFAGLQKKKKKKTEAKVCVNILNKIRVTILIVFKHNICKWGVEGGHGKFVQNLDRNIWSQIPCSLKCWGKKNLRENFATFGHTLGARV